MTIPDKLVQAVLQAWVDNGRITEAHARQDSEWTETARIALAAAFAALPECEEVEASLSQLTMSDRQVNAVLHDLARFGEADQ